jgi:N-acetylmuramoyl-L-alanine amidase
MTKWIQDAGHGGSDPGAVAKGNTEKVYTLEAEHYVDKRLGDHGIYSHCSRSKDETLSVSARTGKVKKYDKCISHHYNAGGGTGAEFIHSIYSDGKFEKLLQDEFEKAGYPVRRIFDRKGSNGDYYYMHRETGACRTTIVEYDFVDGNNSEKIKDTSYREGMYECVVKAICREEGVKYKPLAKPKPKPTSVPGADKHVHRVLVDGKQVGAFGEAENVSEAVEKAVKDGAKSIKVERV